MQIGSKYKIESDAMNITLFEKAKSKTAVTRWRSIAFFSSIKNALEHLIDLEVMETGLTDLKSVTKKQNELYDLIKQLGNTSEGVESCRQAEK